MVKSKAYLFWNWFAVTINPAYWVRHTSISYNWDAIIRNLIENDVPVQYVDSCTVKIGDFEVWTANHPYASFSRYVHSRSSNFDSPVPTRRTQRLAFIYVKQELKKNIDKLIKEKYAKF